MNFTLLGYILAWIAVIWVIVLLAFIGYHYHKLTPIQQAQIESISANKVVVTLVISIAYIIVYHIS